MNNNTKKRRLQLAKEYGRERQQRRGHEGAARAARRKAGY